MRVPGLDDIEDKINDSDFAKEILGEASELELDIIKQMDALMEEGNCTLC